MTQKPFVISFLKVQSNYTKLLIISKDFIWSSYNIHFISLHHYKEPSSSSSSHFNAAVNLKASTSPSFSSSNPKAFDHRPIQRGGGRGGEGRGEIQPCLTGIRPDWWASMNTNFAQGDGNFQRLISKSLNAQGFASNWMTLNFHHNYYHCCHSHH